MVIRKITQHDNLQVAAVIRNVLIEHNVPKMGTAYADVSLDTMYEQYTKPNSVYFVLENEGRIIGGAGIAPLENGPVTICELQKMYFLADARGQGLGTKLMEMCLSAARDFGFLQCYLETMNYMKDAQKLYVKSGFDYLDGPLGDTGHNSCQVWMISSL